MSNAPAVQSGKTRYADKAVLAKASFVAHAVADVWVAPALGQFSGVLRCRRLVYLCASSAFGVAKYSPNDGAFVFPVGFISIFSCFSRSSISLRIGS